MASIWVNFNLNDGLSEAPAVQLIVGDAEDLVNCIEEELASLMQQAGATLTIINQGD